MTTQVSLYIDVDTYSTYLSNQKEKAAGLTRPSFTALSNTGVTWSTEMVLNPIPRIPSNLAATNVIPGCFVASANV